MKTKHLKIHISLLLFIVANLSIGQNIKDVQFEKTSQKFKSTDEGHMISLDYPFSYSGKKTLHILEPKVDCSCTKLIYPKKIEANSTHKITIKFDSNGKIGWQERDVIIQFVEEEKDSPIEYKITFKGKIKASKATKAAFKESQNKQK